MEAIIASLLNRFERGALSRRDPVQGLSLLAAGGVAADAQAPGLKAAKIDHVSIQVTDLPRHGRSHRSATAFPPAPAAHGASGISRASASAASAVPLPAESAVPSSG